MGRDEDGKRRVESGISQVVLFELQSFFHFFLPDFPTSPLSALARHHLSPRIQAQLFQPQAQEAQVFQSSCCCCWD